MDAEIEFVGLGEKKEAVRGAGCIDSLLQARMTKMSFIFRLDRI